MDIGGTGDTRGTVNAVGDAGDIRRGLRGWMTTGFGHNGALCWGHRLTGQLGHLVMLAIGQVICTCRMILI